ncbi:DUF4169 family protein [Sphingomonas sp. BT-65]|uniref:DUF4169 family protein n=1 Tax=Sphingomonas sp. BT-65 TaxID=2989821 RepID=UPI0022362FB2|nr:DUF4169 family protein [Sphingomonas sp. BT-65]MCW4462306.1 DUF4169 family protein [Sphingomonas sp. BT-65]
MGEVVNLNKMRKAKAKTASAAKAVENRAKFGRTKAEKARDDAERTRIERAIDESKRD